MRFFLLFFLVGSFANAQLINNVQLEVVGKPSWQQTISLGDKGVLLFVKTDMTRARIYRFDENLKQQWATDVFLDVERKSTSYFIDKEKTKEGEFSKCGNLIVEYCKTIRKTSFTR